ncbi:Endonuclease/exonuclease/phosphatase [Mycena sanguinolenta]|nr:Endonuclease/exonuclease/phosphatase [Mycena sanguinolenta]
MSIWSAFFRRSPTPPNLSTTIKSTFPAKVPSPPKKLYRYDGKSWIPGPSASESTSFHFTDQPVSLLSWNVDFSAGLVIRRFEAALLHLENLLCPRRALSSPPPRTIILLQEVDTSCFQTLLANAFIREFYHITNLSPPHSYSIREFYHITNLSPPHSYSTLTLVPNPIASLVSSVSRIPFTETRMHRDCLFVDFDIPLAIPNAEPKTLRLRIANTHLESLRGFGDTARPKQLEQISDLLTETGVDAGVVAGDMNAIAPSDQNLPEQLGLSDAWRPNMVSDNGSGTQIDHANFGEAQGHTWGYQPKGRHPPNRLDKILTVGKVAAVDIERVGVGLKLEDRDLHVSDHYGLFSKLVLQP